LPEVQSVTAFPAVLRPPARLDTLSRAALDCPRLYPRSRVRRVRTPGGERRGRAAIPTLTPGAGAAPPWHARAPSRRGTGTASPACTSPT
jgi:hypothetical protein